MQPMTDDAAKPGHQPAGLSKMAMLLMLGWGLSNIAYALYDLPLKFVLKDELKLNPQQISAFFALGIFTNYIKPLAGILTDSVPLFGTRRRWYLLLSLFLCGIGWLVLAFVPRTYNAMLITFALTYSMVVVISTTLGGTMVEVGQRYQAAGRLTAQRIAMFRVGSLAGGPLGAQLAKLPLYVSLSGSALLHFALIPLVWVGLREPERATLKRNIWSEAGTQFKGLVQSKIVLAAAGMIFLIAAAPGFGTPLFFHQTETLKLSKTFLGALALIGAAFGILAAGLYHKACQKVSMKTLLVVSIVVHGLGTLFYLLYRTPMSALVITAIEGVTITLATLPVYDLASRGTPKGSEALGYSVMMSVWNLTNSLSDWIGSTLFTKFGLTFWHLVWINSGTTLLVLLVVPLIPKALLYQTDGVDAKR